MGLYKTGPSEQDIPAYPDGEFMFFPRARAKAIAQDPLRQRLKGFVTAEPFREA
jgi:hypothetical protein